LLVEVERAIYRECVFLLLMVANLVKEIT